MGFANIFVISLFAAKVSTSTLSPPPLSTAYTVTGRLRLHHLETEESFRAYHDQNAGKSRVDFHNGAMKTFRIGSEFHKVVWSPNVKTHLVEEKCFTRPASEEKEKLRGVLPDLADFKFVRTEPCNTDLKPSSIQFSFHGSTCSRFEKNTQDRDRASKSVFWATQHTDKSFIPVRYLVIRYDSLLKSEYDEYEVVYDEYSPGPVKPDLFAVRSVTDKVCTSFPSESGLSVSHLFDPIKEFVHHDDSHVDEHFSRFKNQHGKSYESEAEERQRRHNFLHNMRYVNSFNRRNLTYALKLTDRADLSRSELKSLATCLRPPVTSRSSEPYADGEFENVTIPESIDWRLEGAVTPVKNQGSCGSCWAFAAAAHLESQYFLRHKKLERFSEQELVDCSWEPVNRGCDGGYSTDAFQYVKEKGLSLDSQYGPYLEENGKCKNIETKDKPITTLKNFRVLDGDDALRKTIALRGPVLVSMVVMDSLYQYSHGVYEEPDCNSRQASHVLLAVGYGVLHGKPYWLIKNSWGAGWGSAGYLLITQENNNCLVTSEAVIVDL